MESKALDMSMDTAIVRFGGFLSLKPCAMAVTNGRTAVTVDLRGANPCCESARGRDAVTVGRRSLSRIFEDGHSRLMGLYDRPWSVGFPFDWHFRMWRRGSRRESEEDTVRVRKVDTRCLAIASRQSTISRAMYEKPREILSVISLVRTVRD